MREEFAGRVECLRAALAALDSLAIAYSGGVDSGVLLHAATSMLGSRAFGVLADSPSLPRKELERALDFARSIGARVEVLATHELEDARYQANRGDRCYFCKSALFSTLAPWARERGIARIAFGEIVDDWRDDRPGARAAREFDVLAPLSAAGLTKDDVRRYAREHDLAIADKPASACLASRLPVGTRVTRERLARIESAEDLLHELGLRVVRVRDHGERARIEVGADELETTRSLVPRFETRLRDLGFRELELATYRSPSERAAGAAP